MRIEHPPRDLPTIVARRFEWSIGVPEAFFAREEQRLAEVGLALAQRFREGGRLLVFGNGAWAAHARHIAALFMHPPIADKRVLPALALDSEGVSFIDQLRVLARPQDMALGIAPGEDCTRVSAALLEARNAGLLTLGLIGGDGEGFQESAPDFLFAVNTHDPLIILETHQTLYYVLWALVHLCFEDATLLPHPSLYEQSLTGVDRVLERMRCAIRAQFCESAELRRVLLTDMVPRLISAGQAIARAFARQATLFALGDRQNMMHTQNLVSNLLNPPFLHWRPLPALAFDYEAATPLLGDDATHENMFMRQVCALGRAGDIVLACSANSGADKVLAALEEAKRLDMLTICLTGDSEENLSRSSALDFSFCVPGKHLLRAQEIQATLTHTLLEVVHACVASRPPAREKRSVLAGREKRAIDLRNLI
jgi:D-sedoheptulose 7-phosphate isomerase